MPADCCVLNFTSRHTPTRELIPLKTFSSDLLSFATFRRVIPQLGDVMLLVAPRHMYPINGVLQISIK